MWFIKAVVNLAKSVALTLAVIVVGTWLMGGTFEMKVESCGERLSA